jgi:sulfhydrogenase subunit beta (sulfur reductase)
LLYQIKKTKISQLLNIWSKKYQIWAPVKSGDDFKFKLLNPYGQIEPDKLNRLSLKYPTTTLPPKKILFPPHQKIFKEENGKIKSEFKTKPKIFFGLHLYDLKALSIMDEVNSKPTADTTYLENRKNTILIGISHPKTDLHFHEALGIQVPENFDLFFEDTGNIYLVQTGSKAGESLVKNSIFEKTDWKISKTKEESDAIPYNLEKLAEKIKKSKNSKIWDELAKICFGCGICSYVCPLCYCFEVEDKAEFNSCKTCRKKRWDACMLPEFFALAGTNPKEKLRDRIYNWYHHKFVRFPKEYGTAGCVGCGRCIKYCPADINFREWLDKIINEK